MNITACTYALLRLRAFKHVHTGDTTLTQDVLNFRGSAAAMPQLYDHTTILFKFKLMIHNFSFLLHLFGHPTLIKLVLALQASILIH